MKKDALIIGGGIAGLWCAWELARLGLESTIVETAAFPGGHVAQLCCKATDECRRCGACLLEDVLHKVGSSDRITMLLHSDLLQVQGDSGDFHATVSQRPARIVSDRCNDCGACEATCPVPEALGTLSLGSWTCHRRTEMPLVSGCFVPCVPGNLRSRCREP